MKNLTTFSDKKSVIQAIVFYLFWTIVPFLMLILVDYVFASVPVNYRFMFGLLVSAILPFIIGFTIYTQKDLSKQPLYILVIVLSAYLGWNYGLFIGMLPILFLTTIKRD